MDYTWLYILLSFLAIAYFYSKSIHSYWAKQNVPSMPNPLPIFGHMLPAIIMKENVTDFVRRAYENFETSIVGFYFMGKPGIIVRDVDLVKKILETNFQNFRNNFVKLCKKNDPLFSKSGFFTNDVNIWKEQRSRVSKHLSGKELKYLFIIVDEVCSKTRIFMDREIEKNGGFYECELKRHFARCTSEFVANSALGIEGQSFEDNPKPLSFAKIANSAFGSSLLNDMKEVLLFFLPGVAKFLFISLSERKFEKYMRQNVKTILEQRQRNGEVRNDYLQSSIKLNSDFEGILEDVVNFYIDASETSSSVMANLFYNLSRNPEIQTKLRDYVVSALKENNGQVTYECLKNMTYLDQVIYESMRMTPSMAFQPKYCTEEITLVGGDGISCQLNPGDPVFIPVVNIQHDEKYWPNPEVFDPDRFGLENEANKYTFLAFGKGPRMCVGQRLGLMLAKQVTASLITEFSIERSTRTQVPLKYQASPIFYGFKGGVWACFKKLS